MSSREDLSPEDSSGGKGSWGVLSITVSPLPAKAQGCPGAVPGKEQPPGTATPVGPGCERGVSLGGAGRPRLAAPRAVPTARPGSPAARTRRES